jgi:hypothetical protein
LVKATKKILSFSSSEFFLLFFLTLKIKKQMSTGPKKCGKCEKVVYPAEEIKCLDQVNLSFHS